jgi:hypothetical protein
MAVARPGTEGRWKKGEERREKREERKKFKIITKS